MPDALIGHSGFVGNTLLSQSRFASLFRSNNIEAIRRREFDTVICAGAPAQKQIANRDPAADKANLQELISHLDTIDCKRFVLMSTVDVFHNPVMVDEDSPIDISELSPFGKHRRELEVFVQQRFEQHLIVRLPALVGPGLRANVVYDFLNKKNLQQIDSRGVFQFYPTVNLWYDLQTAMNESLSLIHLTAEPVSIADVHLYGFGTPFSNTTASEPAVYNVQTCYSGLFGGKGVHQYSRRETLQAIRAYAQSEPPTLTVRVRK